ncbi:MAG: hypothetical protein DI589_04630 [Shinella sp.]|nr:MAG: hypothetical protein DI589_04630 [Shinella sp.]
MAMHRKPQWRHQALAETLFQRIAAGEFAIGTALPTEREIAASEKVSRATVREALRFLESRGMIRRRQGSGTIVVAREPQQLRMPLNSLEALLAYPVGTETELLTGGPISSDDRAFAEADLDESGNWYCFSFRRRMPGIAAPVSYIEIYLLEEYADVERDVPPGGGAVFELVEKRYGIHPAEAVVRIDALGVDGTRAEALDVAEGTATVRIQRRYTDADGRLYQVSVSIYPQDRYVFETVIRG